MIMCEYVNCVLIEKWFELNRSMIICEYLKYVLVLNCILIRKQKVNLKQKNDLNTLLTSRAESDIVGMPQDWKSSGILRPRVDETLGVTIFLRIDSMRYWVPTFFGFADETLGVNYCFELSDEALGSILECLTGSVYPSKPEFC